MSTEAPLFARSNVRRYPVRTPLQLAALPLAHSHLARLSIFGWGAPAFFFNFNFLTEDFPVSMSNTSTSSTLAEE